MDFSTVKGDIQNGNRGASHLNVHFQYWIYFVHRSTTKKSTTESEPEKQLALYVPFLLRLPARVCVRCVCVSIVYMCACACLSVHGGQRWASSVFLNYSPPYFVRQGFPLNLEVTGSARLCWPTNSKGFPHFHQTSIEIIGAHYSTCAWVLGI